MRCYYTSGIARIMSDYDIAVPRNRFREAMDLLKGNNNRFKSTTTYSDTVLGSVNGKTVELDVHQWIFKNQGDADNGIWKRAIPIKVLDTTVLVPCPMDMLIHQMHNQCGNIFNMEHPDNHMTWLFDCRHIQLGARYDCAVYYRGNLRRTIQNNPQIRAGGGFYEILPDLILMF